MNLDYLATFFTGIVIGAGLMFYGIWAGIKIVYAIKRDDPLKNKDTPIEQDNTFEQEITE